MRIGIISKRFPPERCGVGDFAYRLAQAYAARGDEVVVFTAPSESPRPNDVRVVEVRLNGWGSIGAVVRAVRREGCERVQMEYSGYAWGRWGFAPWVNALVIALRLAREHVTTAFHETYIHFGVSPKSWIVSIAQRLHVALLSQFANEIVVNTPERYAMFRKWMAWRAHHIMHRANASNIPVAQISSAQREELRAKLDAGEETIVLATFGNFAAAKRYETVIEALAKLAGRLDMRLCLLGDWTAADARYVVALRKRIESLGIGERVTWSGPLPQDEVSAHLQAADIFLLPQPDGDLTRSGAFMAAAAHGLPTIAVRNTANQQEFTHGDNVWLVRESNADEFASAVQNLAHHTGLRQRLGANLRALYSRKFDWPVMNAPLADTTAPVGMARAAGKQI
jgi:glycosyltransferase involved in cell wall biosynthesis